MYLIFPQILYCYSPSFYYLTMYLWDLSKISIERTSTFFSELHCFVCEYSIVYYFFLFIYFLFVVNSVIHWNEKALGSHVFPILIPSPTSLPTRSLQVLPEHQVRALVSCIQPGPVICFTLDSILVSMLFSWNIPPSPSPTESKRLFYNNNPQLKGCWVLPNFW